MGTIISSGVGSGLDISGLVTKLVEAEGAPKKLQLDKQEAKAQAKLSALGSLRSSLSTLRDALSSLKSVDKFQARQASLSSEEFFSATAATTAVAGSYSIEVQRLASAHKLQSGPFVSTSASVGTGTLSIAVGGQVFDVEIGEDKSSLADIAAAINASPAGAKVVATVISGASDARLTLTARELGEAQALAVSQTGGDGGLAALVYPPSGEGLSELTAALDARAFIDGVLVTSATNTISSAIAGVDVTLKKVNELGETTTLSVSQDRNAARKAVEDFVKGYNAFVDALKSLTSYDAETRQGGPLFGDSGVRNIMDQLRRELTTQLGGDATFKSLASIGVTAQLDGKLNIDAIELGAAFDSDFDAVGALFASKDQGLAVKLDALLERHLASQGAIETRTEGLKTTIEGIGERREALAGRLAALQERYLKQFNALDGLLSQLQGTSNFLNQQLSNLPGSAPLNRSRR